MAGAGIRQYRCPEHGLFEQDPGPDPDAVWWQPCPQCQRPADLAPPRAGSGIVLGCAPAVHGDVRMPYISPYLRVPIGSKRDLREARKAAGVVELGPRDCRDAIDQAEVVGSQTRDDIRWRQAQTDPTLCQVETAGHPDDPVRPELQRVRRTRQRRGSGILSRR